MNSPLILDSFTVLRTETDKGTQYSFGSFSHTIPDALSMMTPTDEEVEEEYADLT